MDLGGCALSASEERLLACYLQKESVSDAEAARFVTLKMLATLRETFWGVTAEASKTPALSDEAAAAYTDRIMPSTSRRARSTKSCAPACAGVTTCHRKLSTCARGEAWHVAARSILRPLE